MSHVVLFAYQIKFNISRKKRVTRILPNKLYCHFKRSLQCNQHRCWVKFRVIGTLSFSRMFGMYFGVVPSFIHLFQFHSKLDIDMCSSSNSDCSPNAICRYDGILSRTCTCKPNFEGDGFFCRGKCEARYIHDVIQLTPVLPIGAFQWRQALTHITFSYLHNQKF